MVIRDYNYLVKRIGDIVTQNKCDYILYPFGEYGIAVKEILNNVHNIEEKAIIDNGLSSIHGHIGNLKDLTQMDMDNCKILITSNKPEIYDELREPLYAIVGKEKCIELLPRPAFMQARLLEPEVDKKLKQQGATFENPICHPGKTNSVFFLPLLPMDFIQRRILLSDDYFERQKLDYIFGSYRDGIIGRRIAEGGAVIDAGANIGNHTLYFCNELDAKKVYCFEPIQDTFSILVKNIELNGLEERTVLNPFALGLAGRGSVKGYSVYNVGGASLCQDESGDLEIRDLDSVDIQEPVVLIKIDVEGMEGDVIKGGIGTIKRNQPYIMVESFEESFPEVERMLCEIGYRYEGLGDGDWLFYPA